MPPRRARPSPIPTLFTTLSLALTLPACRQSHGAADPAADQITALPNINPATRTFTNPNPRVTLTYPQGWQPIPSKDFVFMIIPTAPSQQRRAPTTLPWGEHFISLDIPQLPAFRIPGFLPMDQIQKGYLEDLRKSAPNAKSQTLKPPTLPDAKTALVRTTWPPDPPSHPTHAETALLITHNDRVYILRARSPIEQELTTRAAFDAITQSLRWGTK